MMDRAQVMSLIADVIDRREQWSRDRCEYAAREILEAFDVNDLLIINRAQFGIVSASERPDS